jgi:hypothetical protein
MSNLFERIGDILYKLDGIITVLLLIVIGVLLVIHAMNRGAVC